MSKWEDMGRVYRVPTSIVRCVTSILEEAGFPQDECRSGKIWAENIGFPQVSLDT